MKRLRLDAFYTHAVAMMLLWMVTSGCRILHVNDPRKSYFPSAKYVVIDLSEGPDSPSYPISYLSKVPKRGWTDKYKTTHLVLRRVPAGKYHVPYSFQIYEHRSECSVRGVYLENPYRHGIILTQPHYMGVYEVTQRQWERVMGDWPSYFHNPAHRAARPVESVSYDIIRGNNAGRGWPASNEVDADSFLGRLRARTGLPFDLPTEAQWEYASRAGRTTALNTRRHLTNEFRCSNMAEAGRYRYNHPDGFSSSSDVNTGGGTATVGSYAPNRLGIYDMHGNVGEWCLDWYGEITGPTIDRKGPDQGSRRVVRGGSWREDAINVLLRWSREVEYTEEVIGFRIVLPSL